MEDAITTDARLRQRINVVAADMVVLTILALLARVAWHLYAPDRDWPDTAIYLETGQALLSKGAMSSSNYMPGYPLAIALLGYKAVLPFQIVISALSPALVYLLSCELFGSRKAALLSGLMVCFYPLTIFYANMRLTETLYIFLLLLTFLGFYRGRFLAGSIGLVCSILIRPSLDLAAPLLIIAFCFARREVAPSAILRRLALYGVVYIALMALWWWHNWLLYHVFVRLDLAMGNLLIIENTPLFDRFGLDFAKLAPAWEAFSGITDPVARDHAMIAAALEYIRENPLHWLWRCIERFLRFWSPVPGSESQAVNIVAFTATFPVLVMAALAVPRLSKNRLLLLMPIFLIVAYLSAVHSATHAIARYRLPLEPFLMILAGFWLQRICGEFGVKAFRRREPAKAGIPAEAERSL